MRRVLVMACGVYNVVIPVVTSNATMREHTRTILELSHMKDYQTMTP